MCNHKIRINLMRCLRISTARCEIGQCLYTMICFFPGNLDLGWVSERNRSRIAEIVGAPAAIIAAAILSQLSVSQNSKAFLKERQFASQCAISQPTKLQKSDFTYLNVMVIFFNEI